MTYFQRFGPYYLQSVVAGLEPKTHLPFLASLDLLGSQVVRDDFVVNGSCKMQLFGMCETLYQPNMVCLLDYSKDNNNNNINNTNNNNNDNNNNHIVIIIIIKKLSVSLVCMSLLA